MAPTSKLLSFIDGIGRFVAFLSLFEAEDAMMNVMRVSRIDGCAPSQDWHLHLRMITLTVFTELIAPE
jgi:hypothetical protein